MGRPKKGERQADTAEKLREMAAEHFGRRGFQAAALEDIAKDAGVTRTTLLYYFESKEKLYDAVVQEAFTQIASVLLVSMTGRGTLLVRVRRMLRKFLEHVEASPVLAKLMIREVIDERAPGCAIIVNQGMPVLELVEEFLIREGRLAPKQQPLVREILLQITTSVMLKSASGSIRRSFWGDKPRTGELAELLIEGLLLNAVQT